MINQFCKALSNRVLFTNVGYNDNIKYKPCCFFSKEFELDSPQKFQAARILVSSIKTWTPYCYKCKNFEDSGVKSARHDANEDDVSDGIDLEIQLDKTCNAACITCGAWSSTTWQKYNNNIIGKSTKFVIKPNIVSNLEKILKVFDFKKNKIRSIHILGGEPFANDTHLQILSHIPLEYRSSIDVAYTTNGGYKLSQQCLDILGTFKEVDFTFSLDGTNEIFNYHRWPLRWTQVESNILDLISKIENYNFTISVGSTLTPFNIFYFDQLEYWINDISKKYNIDIEFDFWPAFGVMSLASINQDYRNLLFEKYKNNEQLLNYIKSQPYTDYAFDELLKHVNFHDIHRKLNWQNTFSEIAMYF